MNKQKLHTLLGRLSGHLVARSSRQEKEIEQLSRLLSRSFLPEDIQQLKGSSFAFEEADLFFPEQIPSPRSASLESIAESAAERNVRPEFRVFVREVPVRSTQVHASMPQWAAGAAVERTIGPFTRRDGREFWFDFYKIEKLIALHLNGNAHPSLLFKIKEVFWASARGRAKAFAPPTSFNLEAGSIWIHSQILAANAPPDRYTGLTISGGTVKLGGQSQVTSNENTAETIFTSGTVNVKLQLKQPSIGDVDESSTYGVDVRASTLELPAKFSFSFASSGGTLGAIASSHWNVYGHDASFERDTPKPGFYDNYLQRVLIPHKCSTPDFTVYKSQSPFNTVAGQAAIVLSAWALPAASIDLQNLTPASGIGGIFVKCEKGLSVTWAGLEGGALNLNAPYILVEPASIAVADLEAGNMFSQQTFKLWKDELNPFGTTVNIHYPKSTTFFYITFAGGSELLSVLGHADVRIDRPVTVAGEALEIRSKNSLLILAATQNLNLIYLFDDNILLDNVDFKAKPPSLPDPVALALHNALFKVTPVNGCVLFGRLAEDFVKVTNGLLYLSFGMYAYLPTLPDPYAANLGQLRFQFRGEKDGRGPGAKLAGSNIWLWLVCQIKWRATATPDDNNDEVDVSFHFAPLQNQFQPQGAASAPAGLAASDALSARSTPHPVLNVASSHEAIKDDSSREVVRDNPDAVSTGSTGTEAFTMRAATTNKLPNYGGIWDEFTRQLQLDTFALLDVSTNADLLGVSFGQFGGRRTPMITTHVAGAPAGQTPTGFPLQVEGMDVVSQANNVRAFTVPQISWEPVFNLTPPQITGDPSDGFNYYPNDGGPTRIFNSSAEQVALAPIPLTDFLVETFDHDQNFFALTLFTLPFGLKALALLKDKYESDQGPRDGTDLLFNSKSFENDIKGARQLEMDAGDPLVLGEDKMFMGSTVQLNNVLEMDGTAQGDSTLGASVTKIFNYEFMPSNPVDLIRQRGVPLTRIDLSGYGASAFSNWLNPKATIAATSQAKFDIFVGRCAHEVIQVKSILYPWGIRVVRTITLFRTASNYVYRHDSGWKAESAGEFDFSYYVNVPAGGGQLEPKLRPSPYDIHPGVVKALYNVKEIKETEEVGRVEGALTFFNGDKFVDDETGEEFTFPPSPGQNVPDNYELQPVFFNADVEIENAVSGFAVKNVGGKDRKLVPSKHILGFVQLAPRGMPIPIKVFKALLDSQQGNIGGPADCVVNIGNSGQQMRLNRFDVNNAFGADGFSSVFAAAGRGNVILPKDGSWSLVKHEHGTGEVSPVPEDLSVPLIRIGKLIKNAAEQLVLEVDPKDALLRIANPTELLRQSVASTINYGFLHSTDTQKALFLTPAFKQGAQKLLSKTPPLFADAFRIVNSPSIFPNIGNAVDNFGNVISLFKNGNEFKFDPNVLVNDAGKKVLEVMNIGKIADTVSEAGYELLKRVETFDLPDTEMELINIGGDFRIYIEYKSTTGGSTHKGALNFNVNSFAGDLAEKWKSNLGNVGIVVDLGFIERLVTIKGSWDAKKGSEASFPEPKIEFSPELQPVIDLLEILSQLQGGDYAAAVKNGLKLAMSNKAGTWEYKFEASKEIPVLRFPPGPLYNDSNQPLKLEAGLKLGAYFNAAIKIPTDTSQLLPTAGGYFGFYGRLSVMCVSISVGTVYAVGQVNLDIGADTKTGIFLKMKFGFGAQIVVGLPVIANVSVLFMVGVEIYAATQELSVSAFLMFQGHADILGGLVSVTITIEAKGTVKKIPGRTDMIAQVTFALDITIFWVIDISFSESWQEQRQIA
ncbi:MAG TPA: hypothetical protein VJ842_13090 [Pyrinomonadaceae bacterium]|nr:hypothetical protein [Pyrinomonadaceae bacterium]